MKRLLFLGLITVSLWGCSFVLDKNAVQCRADLDCEKFKDHPKCDATGICVPSGLGPPGCFFGVAETDSDISNACSTGQCLSFDNCSRLGLCANAALPPLIPKP